MFGTRCYMRLLRGMNKDEVGQMHVLETVITALLFFGALHVGVTLIPDTQTTTALDTLSITGDDTLRSLLLLEPDVANQTQYQNSTLIYFISTNRTGDITDYLNATLDPSISYQLSLRILPANQVIDLYSMVKNVDESVASHIGFFHEGALYDVILVLWREPRGVAS